MRSSLAQVLVTRDTPSNAVRALQSHCVRPATHGPRQIVSRWQSLMMGDEIRRWRLFILPQSCNVNTYLVFILSMQYKYYITIYFALLINNYFRTVLRYSFWRRLNYWYKKAKSIIKDILWRSCQYKIFKAKCNIAFCTTQ